MHRCGTVGHISHNAATSPVTACLQVLRQVLHQHRQVLNLRGFASQVRTAGPGALHTSLSLCPWPGLVAEPGVPRERQLNLPPGARLQGQLAHYVNTCAGRKRQGEREREEPREKEQEEERKRKTKTGKTNKEKDKF